MGLEHRLLRWTVGIGCALVLLLVFMFPTSSWITPRTEVVIHGFLINRAVRFMINDLCTVGLIFSLFGERKYVIFALWIQLLGSVIFLLPYVLLKLRFPEYNGPMINFIHRLILNPTLLLLLIPAFYLQRRRLGQPEL